MDDTLRLIGQRIQEARKAQGMSQNELAEMLNISPSHMSNIETGRSNFGVDIFKRLTEVLQVSADYILRSNVPAVTGIYSDEISRILEGCSPTEVDAMKKMLKDMKTAIQSAKKTNE